MPGRAGGHDGLPGEVGVDDPQRAEVVGAAVQRGQQREVVAASPGGRAGASRPGAAPTRCGRRRRAPAACRARPRRPRRSAPRPRCTVVPAAGGHDRLPPQHRRVRARRRRRPVTRHPIATGAAAPHAAGPRRGRSPAGLDLVVVAEARRRGRRRPAPGRRRPRPRSRRSWARRPVLRTSTSSRRPAPTAGGGARPPGRWPCAAVAPSCGCSAAAARPTNVAEAGPSTVVVDGAHGRAVHGQHQARQQPAVARRTGPPRRRRRGRSTSPEGSETQNEPASTSVTRVPGGETRMPIGGDHSPPVRRGADTRGISPTRVVRIHWPACPPPPCSRSRTCTSGRGRRRRQRRRDPARAST